jgi:hypothetical protein
MAVDRQRLAAALAYEEERRRRMMESVPTTDNLPPVQPTRRSLRTDLENLSSGIGQGVVNQLEGVKALVTDPVGTARAAYEGVKGIVRDPTVLADALRYTAQKATSGPLGAGEVVGEMFGPMRGKPPMAEIDVYHGSPHRFEEFDASKIGTGEGAQAYGHGIYLAESPAVGRQYAEFLASRKNDLLDPGNLAASMMYRTSEGTKEAGLREIDAALKGIKNFPSAYPDAPQQKAALEKARELLESGAELPKQGGNFYTADLPDEMVDRMLDWDKPLSEQSSAIQDLARKIGAGKAAGPTKAKMKAFIEGKENAERGIVAKGEDLYRALSDYGGQSVEGSRALQSVGIPGIRYLDAGSRGQGGSGTRNFVVFPGEEKKVKILRRE